LLLLLLWLRLLFRDGCALLRVPPGNGHHGLGRSLQMLGLARSRLLRDRRLRHLSLRLWMVGLSWMLNLLLSLGRRLNLRLLLLLWRLM
jgi:hypothetical protein